jgi:hypothetical protein
MSSIYIDHVVVKDIKEDNNRVIILGAYIKPSPVCLEFFVNFQPKYDEIVYIAIDDNCNFYHKLISNNYDDLIEQLKLYNGKFLIQPVQVKYFPPKLYHTSVLP